MRKLFISQPMRGLTDDEILKVREEIRDRAEKAIGEPVELIESFIAEYPGEINKSVPVWYLGKSIQLMSQADIVYFGGDWKNARGCKIEYEIANAYSLLVLSEYYEVEEDITKIKLVNLDLMNVKFEEQVVKAEEEQEEFWKSIEGTDKEHIIEEFFDDVQAKIGVMSFMGIGATRIMSCYPKHLEKMKSRPRDKKC